MTFICRKTKIGVLKKPDLDVQFHGNGAEFANFPPRRLEAVMQNIYVTAVMVEVLDGARLPKHLPDWC